MVHYIEKEKYTMSVGGEKLRQLALKRYLDNPSICEECEKVIMPREGESPSVTRTKRFCDSSCSASFNNRIFIKNPKKIRCCQDCGKPTVGRRLTCDDCYGKVVDWSKITKKEMKDKYEYQKHSRIRSAARSVFFKENSDVKCARCGYRKHVEVCHKKSINSFSDDVPISVINSLENLMGLCPNCHWEFDNGLLIL